VDSWLDDSIIELVKIYPHYPFLKLIMNYLFTPLKPALHNLDKNVCFLHLRSFKTPPSGAVMSDEDDADCAFSMRKGVNIDDKYVCLRLGCDWCSIVNGIMETAKQNIIKNPKLVKRIDFEKLKIADKYLDFILVDRKEKLTNDKIEKWCQKTFGKTTTDLLLLSQIYLKIEMIELQWCPFKRSKEFYYRNKDKRYLEPTEQMIYEFGKIISKHETITCNNCPKVINEKWKYTNSNKPSVFQPLLDYMMEEIHFS
jgi:hypothetical protein